MTYEYAIAGRSFCIQATDEWAASVTRDFLRSFYLDPPAVELKGHPPYNIRISSQERSPEIPAGAERFEVAFGQCSISGDRYYLAIEDSLLLVNPTETGVSLQAWIGSTPHARYRLSLTHFLSYVMEVSLRRCGLFQLHGAGVVPPGEEMGVLILGASGSGKSTITAVLASRGWSYLTDDALLVNREGPRVSARGIRRFFATSNATLESCSLMHLSQALGNPILSDPTKRRLEPTMAFPGQFVSSCEPQILVFASIAGTETSVVREVSRTEAMSQLIRSNPWAGYDRLTAHSHLQVLNRLSNQCRAYSFRGGIDILNEPARAEELLAPLIAR